MQVKPTSAADELSEFYEEVVCDEYQDSNQVQELILSLLSRERKGQYNRFMVGDVNRAFIVLDWQMQLFLWKNITIMLLEKVRKQGSVLIFHRIFEAGKVYFLA